MTIAELHKTPLHALPKDVFSLPAEDFIDAWAKALGIGEGELTAEERNNLARAIRGGTSRMKIVDALRSSSAGATGKTEDFAAHAIRRPPDSFALIERFTRFAPDDDIAFLRYAFSKICDRDPTESERLGLEFDLRRRAVTREEVVRQTVAIARRDGQSAVWDTLEESGDETRKSTDPASARMLPGGLSYDLEGRETLIFVREAPNAGWMIGPDILRQPVNVVDQGWKVAPGWLVVGPKRSLEPSTWRVRIDLLQDPNARIGVDVVANSGLDVLLNATIAGPFAGELCVEIRREHRFVELRLQVLRTRNASSWLRLRDVSMRRDAS